MILSRIASFVAAEKLSAVEVRGPTFVERLLELPLHPRILERLYQGSAHQFLGDLHSRLPKKSRLHQPVELPASRCSR